MIDDDVEDIAGINLTDGLKELILEGVVVVDAVVGHHVESDGALLLKIEVAVYLLDVGVTLQESHHAFLQFTFLAVVTNGIDTHGDDDVVFVVEQFGDGPGEPMDAVGRHGFGHADVERTDDGIGTVVVEDDVVDAEHTGKLLHVALDVDHHLLGDALSKQLTHGCSYHLYACLDDDERDNRTEDAVEVESREEHDSGGDKRRERHHGIEGGISATGLQSVALQLLSLFLHIPAEDELHHDGHDDDHHFGQESGCRVRWRCRTDA